MQPVYTIDVSELPPSAHDVRAPVWWGNTLLMVIESASVVLILAAYFFTRLRFDQWPPPLVHPLRSMAHPVPDLLVPTTNIVLLLLSVVPMLWADRASRKLEASKTYWNVALALAIACASAVLRYYEFDAVHFRWDDNAYGSLVWAIIGMNYVYLWVGLLEIAAVFLWLSIGPFDENHSMDVQLTAAYWYWTVGVATVIYIVVFLSPRLV